MEQLQRAILQYNEVITAYNEANATRFGGVNKYSILINHTKSTSEEIKQLQQKHNFIVPSALLEFYSNVGGLYNEKITERNSISIQPENKVPLNVIIEAILDYWGNDRYEFLPEEGNFTQEQLNYLNDNYKCFGIYLGSDGFEGAGFLYFDKKGFFNEVF